LRSGAILFTRMEPPACLPGDTGCQPDVIGTQPA